MNLYKKVHEALMQLCIELNQNWGNDQIINATPSLLTLMLRMFLVKSNHFWVNYQAINAITTMLIAKK